MATRLAVVKGPDEVWERVRSLPERFRRRAAKGLSAEYQLTVDGAPFTISIVEGSCYVRRGPSVAAVTRIDTDAETWAALDDGASLGWDALLNRRLSVRGNLDLGVRLQTLFHPHGRRRNQTDLEQVDVRADGVKLSAYVFGKGSPVVLLHGLGATKVSWLPVLQPLAERYRLIVPDLPGHGESDKPRTDYSARYYAGVVRAMLDWLDVGRAAFLGNSMGGRIALEVAATTPRRVTGMALLDPSLPGIRWRYVLGFTRFAPTAIAGAPFPIRERWMHVGMRRLFSRPDRISAEAIQAGVDEFTRVYRSARARIAFWSSLRNIVLERPQEFWPRIRKVTTRSLIVWGDRDRLVPLRLGERLADELPRSELVVLPDVGHVPQFEAPRTTNKALLEFLASVS